MVPFQKGEYVRAWPLINQALEMCDGLDELFVGTASEAEALGYLASTRSMSDDMLSCTHYVSDSTDSVMFISGVGKR